MKKPAKSKSTMPPWLVKEAAALKSIHDALKTLPSSRQIPVMKAAAILAGCPL